MRTTNTKTLLEKLNKTELQVLTSEVKETLDVIGFQNKIRMFSAAQLWYIQRQRRMVRSRHLFSY